MPLTITVPKTEFFDEKTETFINIEETEIELEHSLLSLSKWEAKYEKPFLAKGERSREEAFDYIKCMVLTPNLPPEVFLGLTEDNIKAINAYIDSKQTGTTFPRDSSKPSNETLSAELIYYWMFSAGIPKQCEEWHLNKLITLIRVFGVKNSKPKKRSIDEMAAERARENARRKAEWGIPD